MQNITRFVSHYPLTLFCVALIWVLSLAPFFPETPLNDVPFIDKWTHFVMYGGTAAVGWWEHLRRHQPPLWRPLLASTVALLALMGGLIELVQAYCTTTRSGEWADFAADAVGALLGALVMALYQWLRSCCR